MQVVDGCFSCDKLLWMTVWCCGVTAGYLCSCQACGEHLELAGPWAYLLCISPPTCSGQLLLAVWLYTKSFMGFLPFNWPRRTKMFLKEAALSVQLDLVRFDFFLFSCMTLRQAAELANAAVFCLLCSCAGVCYGHGSWGEKRWWAWECILIPNSTLLVSLLKGSLSQLNWPSVGLKLKGRKYIRLMFWFAKFFFPSVGIYQSMR